MAVISPYLTLVLVDAVSDDRAIALICGSELPPQPEILVLFRNLQGMYCAIGPGAGPESILTVVITEFPSHPDDIETFYTDDNEIPLTQS